MKLLFVMDDGHGWLRVPLALLDRLGIRDKISSCSYRDGEYAYLEEDVDYSIFLRKAREAGLEFEERTEVVEGLSPIRDLDRFQEDAAWT